MISIAIGFCHPDGSKKDKQQEKELGEGVR